MRINKYDKVNDLPANAIPVSLYAKENGFKSPAHVYTKYDRYRFGYKTKKGTLVHGSDPGYDIVNWLGTCLVIIRGKEISEKGKK